MDTDQPTRPSKRTLPFGWEISAAKRHELDQPALPVSNLPAVSASSLPPVPLATSSSSSAPPAPGPRLAKQPAAQFYNFEQKSARWLALRRSIGAASISGSNVAQWVGLCPYGDKSPSNMYKAAVGELDATFTGNVHTQYGEMYEERVRLIAEAAIGLPVTSHPEHLPDSDNTGAALHPDTPSSPLTAASAAPDTSGTSHPPSTPVFDSSAPSDGDLLASELERLLFLDAQIGWKPPVCPVQPLVSSIHRTPTPLPFPTAQPVAQIKEYGFFRDRVRRFIGMSPDGETKALRLQGFVGNQLPLGSRPLDVVLGRCMLEIKTSLGGLKPCPLIPHLLQLQLQMRLRECSYGFLIYWHCDKVRMWLMQDSPSLWAWMLRRMDLAHMHVEQRVPIAQDNVFFPWLLNSSAQAKHYFCGTCADYLAWEWFGYRYGSRAPPKAPLQRPRITYQQWAAELEQLHIRPGARPAGVPCPGEAGHDGWLYWSSDIPGGAQTDVDPATAASDPALSALPPECPQIWLVYEYDRAVPLEDLDLLSAPGYVAMHNTGDPLWAAHRFPSVGEYTRTRTANASVDADFTEDKGPNNTRIKYLFVDRFLPVPDLDVAEPTPTDPKVDDTPEEYKRFCKAQRDVLADLERKQAEQEAKCMQDEEARQRRLDAARARVPISTASLFSAVMERSRQLLKQQEQEAAPAAPEEFVFM